MARVGEDGGPGEVRLCDTGSLTEGGTGIRFRVPAGESSVAAFAIRAQGTVRAYLNRCPHLQVELDWEPGEFFDESRVYLVCATHGAVFRPTDGYCISGPCKGGALAPLPVDERAGGVYLLPHDPPR